MSTDEVAEIAPPRSGIDRPGAHNGGRPREIERAIRVARDVILFRALYLAVGWLGRWMMTDQSTRPNFALDHWRRWDAIHFTDIADVGYADSVAQGNGAAFFPGFPMAIRGLALTALGSLTAGMVITTIATIVAAYYLHRLAEHDGHSGDRSVLALLLFPTAVFLVAPYSEAMFLAATIPAYYYARNGRAIAVIPCVFIASFTRTVGLLVTLGAMIELLRGSSSRRPAELARVAAVGVAGILPMIGYGLHLERTKGDFFEFVHAQERGWLRRFTNPLDSFLATWGEWTSDRDANLLVAGRLELVFAALGVALVIWLVLRKDWGYAVFVGGTLLLALSSPLYFSIPRFALTFFPFMFMIADASDTPERAIRLFPALASLSIVGVVVYVNDFWFF